MKKLWKLMLTVAVLAVLFVIVFNVNAGTLRYIYTDSSGTIVTNTITTAEPGNSGASLSYIYTDKDGTVVTNSLTTPTQQAPYFAKGSGYCYNTAGGYIGFFGATPVAVQSVPAAGATATILSNQLKAATTQAALTLLTEAITYQKIDGSTGTVTVVTNVAINTVWGFASTTAGVSTNEIVGTVAPASATNAVKALRNLGLGQ